MCDVTLRHFDIIFWLCLCENDKILSEVTEFTAAVLPKCAITTHDCLQCVDTEKWCFRITYSRVFGECFYLIAAKTDELLKSQAR